MIDTKESLGLKQGLFLIILLLLVMAFLAEEGRFLALIFLPPLLLLFFSSCKRIHMDAQGCKVQILFWKRSYPWSRFQTIRFLDFSKQRGSSSFGVSPYCPGVIFYTKRMKKYPCTWDPDSFLFLHDPFCRKGFYVQFTPTNQYAASLKGAPKERPCYYPVDRETFLSYAEKWGLKIEGLNVPMPPEQLASKKKS